MNDPVRIAACALIWITACGGSATPDAGARVDAAADAGAITTRDAGLSDAGAVDRDAAAEDASMPDAHAPDAGPAAPTFTVMTLNLRCLRLDGTPYATQAARMDAIARTAVSDGVDAIAVQEACDDGATDAFEGLREALEAASGDAWAGQWVFAHLAWAGTADEAEEGVGVLARAIARPTALVHRDAAGLRRAAAAADVDTALGVVRLMSVHFDHRSAADRESQAREAAVVALGEADPSLRALVAGDINARPGSEAHAALEAAGFVRANEAVAAGRIDHVFAHRAAGLAVLDAWVRFDDDATRVSDHPGVVVRFGAAAPPSVTVTRVTAEHDPGFGRHLSIRGDAAPLSWTEGWPMHALAPGRWRWVSTELGGDFAFKVLVDDADWQLGDDERAAAGDDVAITPSF